MLPYIEDTFNSFYSSIFTTSYFINSYNREVIKLTSFISNPPELVLNLSKNSHGKGIIFVSIEIFSKSSYQLEIEKVVKSCNS